jgi:hypothetical protein
LLGLDGHDLHLHHHRGGSGIGQPLVGAVSRFRRVQECGW